MQTDVWLTPPGVIAKLGPFDLDPCAAPNPRPWDTARRHITLPDEDGLACDWSGRVWLNPPFGKYAEDWLRKLVAHGNGIALVPARTETRYWFELIWPHAAGVLFMRGRPHFHRPDGTRASANSGAPIALIAYGTPNADCLSASGLGWYITP